MSRSSEECERSENPRACKLLPGAPVQSPGREPIGRNEWIIGDDRHAQRSGPTSDDATDPTQANNA